MKKFEEILRRSDEINVSMKNLNGYIIRLEYEVSKEDSSYITQLECNTSRHKWSYTKGI